MQLHTPAQLEALTGLSAGTQRNWRVAGHLDGIGVQTPGGQWRFPDSAALFVATTRAVADMGLTLDVATMLARNFLLEVEGAVSGAPRVHPQHRFALAWKRDDCTPEAADALSAGVLRIDRLMHGDRFQDVLTLHQSGEWCAAQTDHLDDFPRLSRAGGTVIIPADLARKIPDAVAALFRKTQG